MFVQIFPSKTRRCRVSKHSLLVSLQANPVSNAAGSKMCIMLIRQRVKKVRRKFFLNYVCGCSSQRWKEASVCFCERWGPRPPGQFKCVGQASPSGRPWSRSGASDDSIGTHHWATINCVTRSNRRMVEEEKCSFKDEWTEKNYIHSSVRQFKTSVPRLLSKRCHFLLIVFWRCCLFFF